MSSKGILALNELLKQYLVTVPLTLYNILISKERENI